MARPHLEEHEKRSQFARARVTPAENARITQQATLAGLTPAEFIRRRLLDYQVPPRSDVAAVDPALITELNRLALQLKSIGNNANQLALSAHTGRKSRTAWADVVDRINATLEAVKSTLEKTVLGDV